MKCSLIISFFILACLAACKEIDPPACEELKQGELTVQNTSDTTYTVAHYVDTTITWITLSAGEQAVRDVPAGTYKFIAKGKKRKEQLTTIPQCGKASFTIE